MARDKIKNVDITPRTDTGRIDGGVPNGVPPGGPPDIVVSQAIQSLTSISNSTAYSENFSQYVSGADAGEGVYSLVGPSDTTPVNLSSIGLSFSTTTLSGASPQVGSLSMRLLVTASGFQYFSNVFTRQVVASAAADTTGPNVPTGFKVTTPTSTSALITGNYPADIVIANSTTSGLRQIEIERALQGGGFNLLAVKTPPGPGVIATFSEALIGASSNTTVSQNGIRWTFTSTGDEQFGSTSDRYKWARTTVNGDFELIATIPAITSDYAWSQVFIGVRASDAADAAFYGVRMTPTSGAPGNGLTPLWRATPASAIVGATNVQLSGEIQVRIVRTGNSWTSYYSNGSDGWNTIAGSEQTVVMTDPVHAGGSFHRRNSGSAVSGSFDLEINKQGNFSHTDSITAGSIYQFRSRAQDLALNYGNYSPIIVAQTTPPANTAIKMHTGHYVEWTRRRWDATERTRFVTLKNQICGTAVKGIRIRLYWYYYETLQSDFTAGFAMVDDMLSILQSCTSTTLRLWLGLETAIYGTSGAGSYPSSVYPPDFQSHTTLYPGSTSSWVVVANTTGWPGNVLAMASLWNSSVMNRAIAVAQAYGDRYNSNPLVEMWGGTQVSSQSPLNAQWSNYGFGWSALATQMKRYLEEVKTEWPNTVVYAPYEYGAGGTSGVLDLVQHAIAIPGVTVGHNDPAWPLNSDGTWNSGAVGARRAWSDAAFLGAYAGLTNRFGIEPWAGGVQLAGYSCDLSYPCSTAAAIRLWFRTQLGAPWVSWQNNDAQSNPAYNWTTGTLPFINANPTTIDVLPSDGNWNTN